MVVHVQYELRALGLALSVFNQFRQRGQEEWVIGLEGFLVHARVLHDFFSANERYPDDVISSDYVDDASAWVPVKPISPEILSRINKQLAHLSRERSNYSIEEFRWPDELLRQIYDEIRTAYTEFVQRLNPDRQAWFANDYGT